MESIHIKLEFPEAMSAKRQILLSEINILDIKTRLNNYFLLRRKELEKREKIRSSLVSLITKIKSLRNSLPKTTFQREHKEKVETEKKNMGMEQELQEIKDRLARLNY